MVYARVLRPPSHGAKLKSFDSSALDRLKGFQVIRGGELVAVLHRCPDEAEKALAKLNAEYHIPSPRFDDKTVFDYFINNADQGTVEESAGNLESGQKLAKEVVEKTYFDSYVAHAAIETHSALAYFEGDKLTVWASTQTPFALQRALARDLDMPSENVRVITPFVGGGFGGKYDNLQAIQVVKIAKIAGKPVQLVWSREDEFFFDKFRPAAVVEVRSGIKADGRIVLWDYIIHGMGDRGATLFYDIPHNRTTVHRQLRNGERQHLLRTGFWRGPDNNTNSFARESHIDVMAARAKMDPLEFRFENLSDVRMGGVLKAGAEKFRWTSAKVPSGRGFGIACGIHWDVRVALFAEVDVNERTGRVKVKRVVCAQDLGLVINPAGARLQVEGCITMGLGYVLSEEVRFQGGRVLHLNFDTYELPRFSWVPKIETILLETDPSRPLGCGEPPIICMGAVVANAVYDATGVRLLQLPMTPKRVKEALAARPKAAASVS